MSVSVAMPKSTGTRALGEHHGTADEQNVKEVLLALFDASDVCLETKTLATTDYILNVGGAIRQDMMERHSKYLPLPPKCWQ